MSANTTATTVTTAKTEGKADGGTAALDMAAAKAASPVPWTHGTGALLPAAFDREGALRSNLQESFKAWGALTEEEKKKHSAAYAEGRATNSAAIDCIAALVRCTDKLPWNERAFVLDAFLMAHFAQLYKVERANENKKRLAALQGLSDLGAIVVDEESGAILSGRSPAPTPLPSARE